MFSSRWIRLAVAIGLLTWLLALSQPAAVWRAMRDASVPLLVSAVALTLFDRALMAWRWLLLLYPLPHGQRPRLRPVVRIFFVSTFVGTFLPGSVGGDLVRAYALNRQAVPMPLAAASVAMDRALGVLSILLVGLLAIALPGDAAPPGIAVVLAGGLGGCLVLGALIFSDRLGELARGWIERVPIGAVRRPALRVLDAVREYRHHHLVLASVLAGSVTVQALRVLQAWCLGLAIGLAVPLAGYFVAIPIVLLVMLLPITVNGLGTSQAAFLWCFGALGVGRPDAFALSVLFLALGIVGNLPGGLLYARSGLHGDAAGAPATGAGRVQNVE